MKMLSEKLRNKELFNVDAEAERRTKSDARRMLNDIVGDLVAAMRAVELDGLYEREAIEDFVSKRLEEYEKTIYLMDAEEFDRYLEARMVNAVARRRLLK